jgi:predicted ATP-grasp superfamily ATP-dependent carboligase
MQGLQAARILARHSIPVVAIARDPHHHACRTKVCEKILIADTTGDELIRALEELGPTLPGKTVLFPCHDQAVRVISRHRSMLSDWYLIVLASEDVVDTLADKQRFLAFASANGVAVPQTLTIRGHEDAERADSELTFPCVIKPVRRSAAWDAHAMSKAFRAESRDEFLAIYKRVSGWSTALVAQQWIPGTEADLYSCNCYYDRRGKLVASFIARKLRQWPPVVGSSCLGEECRNDVVLEEAVRIFDKIGYTGLGYIEMKRNARSGKHYAIEANIGRPTGRSAIAEAGGVQMLYAMYCDALGQALPDDLQQNYQGVKWIDLRHDIQSALHYLRKGELTLAGWYRSWRGRKVYAVFSWSDPMPFWADLWRAFGILVSRKKRALRRRSATVPSTDSLQYRPIQWKKHDLEDIDIKPAIRRFD